MWIVIYAEVLKSSQRYMGMMHAYKCACVCVGGGGGEEEVVVVVGVGGEVFVGVSYICVWANVYVCICIRVTGRRFSLS